MLTRRFLPVTCAVLLAPWSPAAGSGGEPGQKGRPPGQGAAELPPDPEIAPELRARIDALVKGLGAEKYQDRQDARDGLLAVGRPALVALRAAAGSGDPEVADAARKLAAEIEGGKARTTVKVKTSGSRQGGDLEIAVISSVDTVTVRDFKGAFSVAVQPAAGKQELYSEPTREDFAKKHPQVWRKYAEPALDERDAERVVREAMVRELIPQARSQFLKAQGREPGAAEIEGLEQLIREKLEEAFKKRTEVRPGAGAGGGPSGGQDAPAAAPRRRPPEGPELAPLD